MTPLWEELAGQTADAAAAIKNGQNCQVSSRTLQMHRGAFFFGSYFGTFLANTWLILPWLLGGL